MLLPIPDTKVGPGRMLQVREKDGKVTVNWLGDFRRCGLINTDMGFTPGKSPPITFSKALAFDASVALSFKGVEVGPEFSKAKTTKLDVKESGGDAIDLLALSIWFAAPGNVDRMPAPCREFLRTPDVYLVSEAFRVSKGTYTLHDQNGAKLKVSITGLSPLKVGGGVSVTDEGGVTFDEPFYLAVRRARELSPGTFVTLGQPKAAHKEADALIEKASGQAHGN